ncbi:hypothetical protein EB796_006423 [Bugula neritina]|uniref:Uncharacterized protein n=1 Tax=Bugula neritina TaxID=10212 RepID=A0A7J7KBQ8_BUGNE|nr:hypothetical protein EB796_006423 [Bugula neritina]
MYIREEVYNDSTRHDPVAGPNTGPAGGPNTGPGAGRNTGPGAGPNTGPAAGGPNTGPAGGPNTGPGYTVNQNLAAYESFGNESVRPLHTVLPLKPVGNPHHRTRMQNHNTGSSGSIAAPSSTDTKIQRPELANGFQNPRKTQTRKAHGSKKRRSSSPEPIGSSRGCKQLMLGLLS